MAPGFYPLEVGLNDGDTTLFVRWTVQVLKANTTDIDRTPEAAYTFSIALFPNPFQERVNLQYQLSEEAMVSVDVFATSGQKIAGLVHEHQGSGMYTLAWDGRNAEQQPVPSGVYICRFLFKTAESTYRQERKIVYIP